MTTDSKPSKIKQLAAVAVLFGLGFLFGYFVLASIL